LGLIDYENEHSSNHTTQFRSDRLRKLRDFVLQKGNIRHKTKASGSNIQLAQVFDSNDSKDHRCKKHSRKNKNVKNVAKIKKRLKMLNKKHWP